VSQLESRVADSVGWLLAGAAVLVGCGVLLRGQLPMGHDWPYELVRPAQYLWAVRDGQFPPAWSPHEFYGYGAPTWLLYAPAYAGLAAVGAALLGTPAAGAVLAGLLTALIGAGRAAAAGHAAGGSARASAARIAVVLFALHPYVLYDRLARNANAELLALCFALLAFAGLLRIRDGARGGAALLAAGVGLTLLAHNLMALSIVGAICLALPVLCWAERARLARGVGAIALGMAVGAVYWLPMLWAAGLVRLDEGIPPFRDYVLHFRELGALLGTQPDAVAGPLTLVVLGGAIGVAAWRGPLDPAVRRTLVVGGVGGAALLWLAHGSSAPIWAATAPLQRFQFPWRMLGPLAVVVAVTGASLAAVLLAGQTARTRVLVEAGVLAAALAVGLPQLRASEPVPTEWAASFDAFASDEEALRASGAPAVLSALFVPQSADPAASAQDRGVGPAGRVLGAPAGSAVRILAQAGTFTEAAVGAPEPGSLVFARWGFPGWHAEVDGAAVEWTLAPGGRISVPVPAGEHLVTLRYNNPPVRRAATALSLLALALWMELTRRALRVPRVPASAP
jgi:hypothetical protein